MAGAITTDDNGLVRIKRRSADQAVWVGLIEERYGEKVLRQARRVEALSKRVHLDWALPLRINVFDAESGRRADDVSELQRDSENPDLPPRFSSVGRFDDICLLDGVWGAAKYSGNSGERYLLQSPEPGASALPIEFGDAVSPYAKELALDVHLKPSVSVEVALFDAMHAPVRGVKQVCVAWDGMDWGYGYPYRFDEAQGVVSLSVPHYRRARLRLSVDPVVDAGDPEIITCVMPERFSRTLELQHVFEPPAIDGGRSSPCSDDLEFNESFGATEAAWDPLPGGLLLSTRVTRRTHQPVSGARVWLTPIGTGNRVVSGQTDGNGYCIFSDLPDGAYVLRASGLGLVVPRARVVEPRVNQIVHADMHEAPGAMVNLHIVDETGRGLGGAGFSVQIPGPHAWCNVEEDVQHMGRTANHEGRVRLHHLPPGRVEVHVFYGPRSVRTKLELKAGERRAVKVVVPLQD